MGNLNQKRRCSSLHEYFQGTVGERIQDLLREKKMTQAVLAQRTQISKATLNRYITDENSRIPHDALLQIARALDVSTDFLLGATDIPYRTNYDIDELGLTAAACCQALHRRAEPAYRQSAAGESVFRPDGQRDRRLYGRNRINSCGDI